MWGSHDICPLLTQFYAMAITWSFLLAISWAKAWRNTKKPKLSMAYLLIVPVQAVEEERTFGLVAVWVHPCQTLLSSLEEAVKKLTLLVNTAYDWPYAFLQLCEDSQHIPLSNARHISIMVNGAPSRSTCRCLSCLEVCKFLQCSSEVVYPEGLNEGFEPTQVPLPKQSVWDMESPNEPAMLQVNLPRPTCRDVTTAASQWSLMPISFPHSVTECLSDTVTRPSMEEEVGRHLSGTLFQHARTVWCTCLPRRPPPMTANTLVASKGEDPPDLGEIIPVYPKQPPPSPHKSSQAGMADVMAHSSCSPSPMPGTLERNGTSSLPRATD